MDEEGKDDVGKEPEDIKPDASGKYPEVVPWNQYVGIKESLGKKLDSERAKVTSLEERLKGAASTEELGKLKMELEETKTKLQTTTTELTGIKDKSVSEKRATLVKRGIPEDEVKDMSDQELSAALKVLAHSKPAPDMGGGGGSTELKGSPLDLAVRAYGGK